MTVGDTPLDPSVTDNVKGKGRKRDLVATDDFIYGEPRAISDCMLADGFECAVP